MIFTDFQLNIIIGFLLIAILGLIIKKYMTEGIAVENFIENFAKRVRRKRSPRRRKPTLGSTAPLLGSTGAPSLASVFNSEQESAIQSLVSSEIKTDMELSSEGLINTLKSANQEQLVNLEKVIKSEAESQYNYIVSETNNKITNLQNMINQIKSESINEITTLTNNYNMTQSENNNRINNFQTTLQNLVNEINSETTNKVNMVQNMINVIQSESSNKLMSLENIINNAQSEISNKANNLQSIANNLQSSQSEINNRANNLQSLVNNVQSAQSENNNKVSSLQSLFGSFQSESSNKLSSLQSLLGTHSSLLSEMESTYKNLSKTPHGELINTHGELLSELQNNYKTISGELINHSESLSELKEHSNRFHKKFSSIIGDEGIINSNSEALFLNGNPMYFDTPDFYNKDDAYYLQKIAGEQTPFLRLNLPNYDSDYLEISGGSSSTTQHRFQNNGNVFHRGDMVLYGDLLLRRNDGNDMVFQQDGKVCLRNSVTGENSKCFNTLSEVSYNLTMPRTAF